MIRTPRRAPALAAALLAVSATAACGGDDQPAAAPVGDGPVVELVKLEFQPAEITVAPGTTVTWLWTEQAAHNVVAEDGEFESEVQPRGTFAHTFEDPGEYPYVCTLHPGMEGVVTVE